MVPSVPKKKGKKRAAPFGEQMVHAYKTGVLRVYRIQNKLLWEKYQLEAKQLKQKLGRDSARLMLWHGTRETDP